MGRTSLKSLSQSILKTLASLVPPPCTTFQDYAWCSSLWGYCASFRSEHICVPHLWPHQVVVYHFILQESGQTYDQPCRPRSNIPTWFETFGEVSLSQESWSQEKMALTSSPFVLLHWHLQSQVIKFPCHSGDQQTLPMDSALRATVLPSDQ